MKKHKISSAILAGALLVAITGCGTTSSTSPASAQNPVTTGGNGSNGGRHNFQMKWEMTPNPAEPSAGHPFTLSFSMQMPQRGTGYHAGNRTGNSMGGGYGSGGYGNHAGNGTRGGSNGSSMQPNMTITVTGNGVNQTLHPTNQQRVWSAQDTISKPGTYQVALQMEMGQRNVTQTFTLTVK